MTTRSWTGMISVFFMLLLIFDSETAVSAAQSGVDLCLKVIIPSLFPFFMISNIMVNSLQKSESKFLKFFAKCFRIPEQAGSIAISAFLGGYPIGAQCIAELYRNNSLTRKDAEQLLAYCNNAGPAFIFGITPGLFCQKWIPWILWATHIIAAFLVSRWYTDKYDYAEHSSHRELSFQDALLMALHSIAKVCGCIVLFRIIIIFLTKWILIFLPTQVQVLIIGLVELTNGCYALENIKPESVKLILLSGMLAFGGLCITVQTASVTAGLNLKHYLLGKTMQFFISILLMWSFLSCIYYLPVIFIILFFAPKLIKKSSILYNNDV